MTENLDTLRNIAEAATPGPWHWSGNAKMNNLYLATWIKGVGRCSVMDFERWGMQQAIPRFLDDDSLMMQTAKDLLVFEVARNQGLPDDTPSSDPRVYRQEVVDVRHPNAKFMAAANPEVVLALLSRLEQAEQKVASLEAKMDGESLRWVAWEMVENSGHLDLPIVTWINRISDDEVSLDAAKYFFFGGTSPCIHLGSYEPFDIGDEDRPACEHCNRRALDGDGRG